MRGTLPQRPAFFAILLILVGTLPSAALEIPPSPGGYVNDYAGLISPEARSSIASTLKSFEEQTSNQIVVVIFDSLDGQVLEDFTFRLASTWKVGQKDKKNGVILALFVKDRKSRIEVGYGLEGVLPDAVCARILRNEITPYFRQGQYEEGIRSAVDAIQKATRGEYTSDSAGIRLDFSRAVTLFVVSVFFLFFAAVSPLPLYLMMAIGFPILIKLFDLPLAVWFFIIPVIFLIEWIRQKWILPRLGTTIHYSRRRGYQGGYWGGFGGGGGWAGGGGTGGGFSGGGGSFGGGGASGGW